MRPPPPIPKSSGPPPVLPMDVQATLRRVATRLFRVRLAEGALWLAAALPALWLAQALADRAFDLPWTVRLLLLLGDAAAVGYLGWKYAFVPWRQRLTARTAALHVERAMPEFQSALISAVELAHGRPGLPQGAPALVRALVAQVGARVQTPGLARRVVRSGHLKRCGWYAALALALAGGVAALFPWTAGILARRILLSQVPLPTRTAVVPITKDIALEVGATATLSARARKAVPRSGWVWIIYANHERTQLPVLPQTDHPDVFTLTLNNVQQSFSYHFALGDGTGEDYPVQAVVPPVLESCRFVQRYPDYTGLKPAEMSAGNLSLLAGSHVRIEGRATQGLRSAVLQLEGIPQSVTMETTGADRRSIRGEFAVPKEGLTGFSVVLTNAHGWTAKQNMVYRVELVADKPPVVELASPRSVRVPVVLGSRPTLTFSARDDFGLARVAVRYQIERPAPPGGGPAPIQDGEIALPPPANASVYRQSYVWDLSAIRPVLVGGCTVQYWIEATDNNNVTGPSVGQSEKKTFAVLTEADFKAELLRVLGGKADAIDTIYNTQQELNEKVDSAIRKDNP